MIRKPVKSRIYENITFFFHFFDEENNVMKGLKDLLKIFCATLFQNIYSSLYTALNLEEILAA